MNKDFEKKKIDKEKRRENMTKAKEEFGVEVGEDNTKYGEFISSYFAWISLPEQKEKVEKMQKMTKKKENKK
ncbi:MAG: hypothetical protein J6A04_06850 [Clostridia bacterium]|nr:hypothetical protein [Clostridia bacterium]